MSELNSFYLVLPPGLVAEGQFELILKWREFFGDSPLEIKSVDDAGLLIECPLYLGLNLNLILKTPTRILLRIDEFNARDFPKLFQKIARIPWRKYILSSDINIESSAALSRVFDSRKIEKAVLDGVKKSFTDQPSKKKYSDYLEKNKNKTRPKIYVRLFEDTATISLDTTGELLYKRGEKTLTGLAPIRESLAALLLTALIKKENFGSLGNSILIDPMSGSGSFLIEAHDYFKMNLSRDYAYYFTPFFLDLEHNSVLKKEISEKITPPSKTLFKELIGFEIDPSIVDLQKENTKDRQIKTIQADLFEDNIQDKFQDNTFVIINPPYGKRVGESITVMFYHDIISAVKKKFNPYLLGIIIPDDYNFNASKYNVVDKKIFKNGGIPVGFYIIKR